MSDRIDLPAMLRASAAEAIENGEEFSLSDFRDNLADALGELTEGSIIYRADALAILARYDDAADADHAEDAKQFLSGKKFAADEWEDAMREWARCISLDVLDDEMQRIAETAERTYESLADFAEKRGDHRPTVRTHKECPWGTLAHAEETEGGILYWPDAEGSRSAAVRCFGFWLTCTWENESRKDGAEDEQA